jgi:peptide/nickel transport system substrate-binding protein
MRRSRSFGAVLAGLVTVGVVGAGVATADTTSPSPSTTASSSDSGKVIFRVGTTGNPDSLNPFTGVGATSYEIWGIMYDTLTMYSAKDFSVAPGLATAWVESPDHTTWTYTIRSGQTWSDGVPLTARDVAYTFNRIIHGNYEKTNYGNYVRTITSVKAPNDTTVVMTVKKPSPVMLHLGVYILPEHIWKNISEDQVKKFKNTPDVPGGAVGSGAFKLVEARDGQSFSLVANPDYWAGAPHVDGVTYLIYKNQEALGLALQSGAIDFADGIDASEFRALQNKPNITTRSSQYYEFGYITMNGGAALADGTPIGDGHPALKDPRVRLAIEYATDKQALVDRVLDGHGSVGTTVIPPLYPYHYEPTDPHAFDIAKANQILDDAGYKMGPGGVRVMPAGGPDPGRPLEFRLYGRSSSTSSQETVQFEASWLKQIGIKADVKIVNSNYLYTIAGQGNFDMYEWDWIPEPDPDSQLSVFTCAKRSYKDGGAIYANLSDSFYCNKKYDALYAQQAVQTDVAQRMETVKKMQAILYDAVPYIVTNYPDYLQAYRSDRFTGYTPQPAPGGAVLFQWGNYSYLSIHLVGSSNGESSGSGPSSGLLVGIALLVVVVVVIAVLLARRRSAGSDDLE